MQFRNHPLAKECDIVETLHMRLTLLQMTFGKHIERKHVCFFAGEVSTKKRLEYIECYYNKGYKKKMKKKILLYISDFGRSTADLILY